MTFKNLGLIFGPDHTFEWQKSHAMLPTPYKLEKNLFRIFYGSRNSENQSHIDFFDFNTKTLDVCNSIHPHPVLKPGRLGSFDDNGVLPSCVLEVDNEIFMYYIGFKPGGTTRMDLFGGLAISSDYGLSFSRWSESPIIERSRINPFINTAPWVIKIKSIFVMYYVAGVEWVNPNLPRYNIQIATSDDGKTWERNGVVAIDFEGNENALARPFVFFSKNKYIMWFSAKGENYSPCIAESHDGFNWSRISAPNIEVISGLNDEMTCYPVCIQDENKIFVLFNGNNYGERGVILALNDSV